ncbi:hypothetical protein [uncultured Agrobacterium sp.]|uniref:hypothetical protein n=1 Tax=uncultured Agrobacterium sp. TaxID=157277 RepID=UPI0025CBE47E|nr:hypothetical protein [uncultured Agrobacterium sp.]
MSEENQILEITHGFYHPIRGYWQTLTRPSQDILDTYPEGTIPYPLKPGEHYSPKNGGWIFVEPTSEPLSDMVKVVFADHIWERMTLKEADQVGAAMKQRDFRTRKIFESVSSYRSDHQIWPLLHQIVTQLFGAERAAQILAPSELVPA